jgi:hypothetical protein
MQLIGGGLGHNWYPIVDMPFSLQSVNSLFNNNDMMSTFEEYDYITTRECDKSFENNNNCLEI